MFQIRSMARLTILTSSLEARIASRSLTLADPVLENKASSHKPYVVLVSKTMKTVCQRLVADTL